MSKSPRTDAHCKEIGGDDGLCYADFARTLELELTRTREALKEALDGWEWNGHVVDNNGLGTSDLSDDPERIDRIAAIRKELGL